MHQNSTQYAQIPCSDCSPENQDYKDVSNSKCLQTLRAWKSIFVAFSKHSDVDLMLQCLYSAWENTIQYSNNLKGLYAPLEWVWLHEKDKQLFRDFFLLNPGAYTMFRDTKKLPRPDKSLFYMSHLFSVYEKSFRKEVMRWFNFRKKDARSAKKKAVRRQ